MKVSMHEQMIVISVMYVCISHGQLPSPLQISHTSSPAARSVLESIATFILHLGVVLKPSMMIRIFLLSRSDNRAAYCKARRI